MLTCLNEAKSVSLESRKVEPDVNCSTTPKDKVAIYGR